jgi:hypothetical protein
MTLVMMASLCLSTQAFAQAEGSVVQKMKFNCSKNADASYLLYEGTARMISSVEGTIEIDSSKGVAEDGGGKFPSIVSLKYSLRFERNTPIAGQEVGMAKGEIKSSTGFYQYANGKRMLFGVDKSENGNYASVSVSFSEKTGWVASISSWFDSPDSSEDLKSTNMRVTMPCSMEDAE